MSSDGEAITTTLQQCGIGGRQYIENRHLKTRAFP